MGFRRDRVGSTNVPYWFVAFLLLVVSVGGAQTISDELAIAKARFQKKAEAMGSAIPADLNAKYSGGIEAIRDKKQAEGDLKAVLALAEELKSIESSAAPGKTEVDAESDLGRMRAIYADAFRKWSNGQVNAFERLKREYIAELAELTSALTKENRVDDALAVRGEAVNVQKMILADFGGGDAPADGMVNPSGKREGRIRGFGRTATTKWHSEWEDLDLAPLRQFEDFVEVAGSQYHLLFRRKNGDVLDRDGKTVGQNAAKLIPAASQIGYVDAEGKYYELFDGEVLAEAQPLKTLVKKNSRRLAINHNGDLVSWGGQYDSNERKVPEAALKNIKQVSMFWDDDFALNESGELFRWNQKKVVQMPPQITTGVQKISIYQYTGYALSESNDLYYLNGVLAPFWNEKAKNIICRGEFAAIMDMEDHWHVFAHNKTPRGNELEVLNVVMNRPETIDVEFNLFNSKQNNKGTASYAVWIEEASASEIDVKDTTALPPTPTTTRKSGTGFFGTEIE